MVGRDGVAPPEPQGQEIYSLPRYYLRNNTPSLSKSLSYGWLPRQGSNPPSSPSPMTTAGQACNIRINPPQADCTTDCATRQHVSCPVHGRRAVKAGARADRSGSADSSRRHSVCIVPSPLQDQHDGVCGAVFVCYFTLRRFSHASSHGVHGVSAVYMGTKKAPGPLPRGFCLRMYAQSGHEIHRSHRASGYMERITI